MDKVKTIFYKLEEILEGHLVFQIALHDRIKTWDTHEEIGGIFLENVGVHSFLSYRLSML